MKKKKKRLPHNFQIRYNKRWFYHAKGSMVQGEDVEDEQISPKIEMEPTSSLRNSSISGPTKKTGYLTSSNSSEDKSRKQAAEEEIKPFVFEGSTTGSQRREVQPNRYKYENILTLPNVFKEP